MITALQKIQAAAEAAEAGWAAAEAADAAWGAAWAELEAAWAELEATGAVRDSAEGECAVRDAAAEKQRLLRRGEVK